MMIEKHSSTDYNESYNFRPYLITFARIKNQLLKKQRIYYLKVLSATFFLVCFVSLKESTYETRKSVSYFTSKALFVLEIIKF